LSPIAQNYAQPILMRNLYIGQRSIGDIVANIAG